MKKRLFIAALVFIIFAAASGGNKDDSTPNAGTKIEQEKVSLPISDKQGAADKHFVPADDEGITAVQQEIGADDILPDNTDEWPHDIDEGANRTDVEWSVYKKINTERYKNGIHELIYDDDLARVALARAKEMYDYDFFEHERHDGSDWWTMLSDMGVPYIVAGENLGRASYNQYFKDAYGSASTDYWYGIWSRSPSHYEAMVDTDYTHVGLGIYHGVKDGEYYEIAVTIFAYY